jgi:hypothetical protein
MPCEVQLPAEALLRLGLGLFCIALPLHETNTLYAALQEMKEVVDNGAEILKQPNNLMCSVAYHVLFKLILKKSVCIGLQMHLKIKCRWYDLLQRENEKDT